MTLLILSFISGVLTITAPCILPLLPVIVSGSLINSDPKRKSWLRPVIIAGSLAISVIVFTLLLKGTTLLLDIPQTTWQIISGGIIVGLGLVTIRPDIWERLPGVNRLNLSANAALSGSYKQGSIKGAILMGAALGPVFNSCSPTYALVVASVLPSSFIQGLVYLAAYAVGLAGSLLVVAFAGQSVAQKLGWINQPGNRLKLFIGSAFIVVGVSLLFGLDKRVQSFIIERGWYAPVSNLEQSLR